MSAVTIESAVPEQVGLRYVHTVYEQQAYLKGINSHVCWG